jgi:CDP-glucose 4,6-dehydratase
LVDIRADVRDLARLREALHTHQPAFIFHLAAQALVLESYAAPLETFGTNVMGSLTLLQAVREVGITPVMVMVTTDKCYENQEWVYGYRETDALGGHDPYSASKAAMEIAVASFRRSFFAEGPPLATVRAGNVIGGGDWSAYRIVPDAMRAFSAGQRLQVRNPGALRPWQHVLDPLSGYLWLAARLRDAPHLAGAWNFGPLFTEAKSVGQLVAALVDAWEGPAAWDDASQADAPKEAHYLTLNIEKAVATLGWRPVWDFQTAVQRSVRWYQTALPDPTTAAHLCLEDIAAYEAAARAAGLAWTD